MLCLLGPTASGKTSLALDLASRFALDIISVDSALIYRGMDIGTAKPDTDTLRRYPHALVDIIDPWQSYSVSRFLHDAQLAIESAWQAQRVPLLVGGTMLYYQRLRQGLDHMPEANPYVRERLQKQLQDHGSAALHRQLRQIDPAAAARIHENDPQRLIRALEVYELSGKTMSEWRTRQSSGVLQTTNNFALGLFPRDRALLHQRIAERFDQMLDDGFELEVNALYSDERMNAEMPSMRCVGYRQMWEYLAGVGDFSAMRERAIAATRQLAKRQFTWMRAMHWLQRVDWLSADAARQRARNDLYRWLELAALTLRDEAYKKPDD